MGSSLPAVSSPSLILTHPTPSERTRICTHTQKQWGGALSVNAYLEREVFLTTVPLARNNGLTHWILTLKDAPPDSRPILSSCESLRKRAVAVFPPTSSHGAQEPKEGVAHAIASVFTEPQYRGSGYASRMMTELGLVLKSWQADTLENQQWPAASTALFSVLYSDVGKTFYAKNGWAPMRSTHVAFKPLFGNDAQKTENNLRPLNYDDLPPLCHLDVAQLRQTLLRTPTQASLAKEKLPHSPPRIALLPDLDAILWHLLREDYMTQKIFSRTPTIRGAQCGRLWAVWMRGYYGGLNCSEGNTLHILRVAIEGDDEDQKDENEKELAAAFKRVMQLARREAGEWKANEVQMWNLTSKMSRLLKMSGLEHEVVEREEESIPSLMWYGEGKSGDVDWLANEKYGWC